MKIGGVSGNSPVENGLEVSRDKKLGGAGNFANLLSGEINSGGKDTSSSGKTTEATPAMDMRIYGASLCAASPVAGPEDATAAADSAGCTLDSIEKAVSAPNPSLSSLQAAIDSLSSQAGDLQEKTAGLPDSNPLKRVGDELSVLAYVEKVKWSRGDYL